MLKTMDAVYPYLSCDGVPSHCRIRIFESPSDRPQSDGTDVYVIATQLWAHPRCGADIGQNAEILAAQVCALEAQRLKAADPRREGITFFQWIEHIPANLPALPERRITVVRFDALPGARLRVKERINVSGSAALFEQSLREPFGD